MKRLNILNSQCTYDVIEYQLTKCNYCHQTFKNNIKIYLIQLNVSSSNENKNNVLQIKKIPNEKITISLIYSH